MYSCSIQFKCLFFSRRLLPFQFLSPSTYNKMLHLQNILYTIYIQCMSTFIFLFLFQNKFQTIKASSVFRFNAFRLIGFLLIFFFIYSLQTTNRKFVFESWFIKISYSMIHYTPIGNMATTFIFLLFLSKCNSKSKYC